MYVELYEKFIDLWYAPNILNGLVMIIFFVYDKFLNNKDIFNDIDVVKKDLIQRREDAMRKLLSPLIKRTNFKVKLNWENDFDGKEFFKETDRCRERILVINKYCKRYNELQKNSIYFLLLIAVIFVLGFSQSMRGFSLIFSLLFFSYLFIKIVMITRMNAEINNFKIDD